MSDQQARRFMQCGQRFGEIQQFVEFKPSILYALAAPSTPNEVVEKAIEKAESGESLTVAENETPGSHFEEVLLHHRFPEIHKILCRRRRVLAIKCQIILHFPRQFYSCWPPHQPLMKW